LTAMNWAHVTQKITVDFHLEGCFLLDKHTDEWVGDKPPENFRNYLRELFRTKPASYLSQIRFFKLKSDGANHPASFLALLPIELKHVNYNFLGLNYQSPDQLQELLRFRIMPMYLLFYLHQMIAEARVRNTEQAAGQKTLLRALDEKRIYAQQLENKVKNLYSEIDNVKSAGLSQDQMIGELTRLVEERNKDYQELAESYQALFTEHQEVESDYLTSSIGFECRINDLENKNSRMSTQLMAEQGTAETVPRALFENLQLQFKEARGLAERHLEEQLVQAARHREKAEEVDQLVTQLGAMRSKVDYYRKRLAQQEKQLKQLKNDALVMQAAQHVKKV